MSNYERNIAVREGHLAHDSDAYFEARPQVDTGHNRAIFEAGHERGYKAAQIATEADALMREMHSALEEYEACHNLAKNGLIAPDWGSARIQAQTALKHYQEYVK